MKWTLADVARATGGRPVGDPSLVVGGVGTDSRRVGEDELFVALIGERHDGHHFVDEALAAGAAAVLVGEGRTEAEPRVEVGDTLEALRDLAARRRDELDVPVAAITGSTGKTSTKELLAAALGPGAWAAPRSYNNEVGVPLTVLSTPEEADALVVEVGSRGPGHIRWLMPAVRPDVAVITGVGAAHLETFGDLETVARAKWELVEALGRAGTAVLPAEHPLLEDRRLPEGVERVTFGCVETADVRVLDLRLEDDGRPRFSLQTPAGRLQLRLAMAGRHQALNAAAATAAALALGRDPKQATAGLEQATGAAWRMEVHRGSFTVVNDAYNANPASMEAALRTVAEMPGTRRVAVLGRMAELGDVAAEEHRRIGSLARRLGFDPILVVGEDPGLAEGAGSGTRAVADAEEAADRLIGALRPGDLVLVKGSRVVGLERTAARLVEAAG